MPFEADLAHALDRTTDSLEPDLTAIVGGAVERGRGRRRRRSAAVAAGVGACVAIAAAGVMAPQMLAGLRSTGSEGVSPMSAPRSAIADTQMIQTLEATFPGARFSQVTGQSSNPSDPSSGNVANAGLVLDDGQGAASVGVSAVRLKLPLRDGDGLSCDRTPARAAGDTCKMSELPSSATIPGGALVMSEQTAAKQPAHADTARRWTVTVTVKSTGAQLQMVQWNTAVGSGPDTPKPTRTAPPLSEQQVVAALTGSTWAPILGAVG
ncbi:hypothetical protein [Streptomyces sp. NRRL S-350]|uniref:hypothetical protein n=1 Tax=Streptomyces sp. NRRL S-350 TaxID=1463902 RepID=UPI000A6AB4B3|nr:hypothetical protein [Streptomyces sp. NRRL S-350]